MLDDTIWATNESYGMLLLMLVLEQQLDISIQGEDVRMDGCAPSIWNQSTLLFTAAFTDGPELL